MENKKTEYQDFTLLLALFDLLPVILFGLCLIVFSSLINSIFFLIGAILCLWAGVAKVLWKIIVVLKKKDIRFLFIQMRVVMPIGLVLMILGCIFTKSDLLKIYSKMLVFPIYVLFIAGFVGMLLMSIFAFALDNKKAKNNWIEEIVNTLAQLCFLIGLLLIKYL